jgi:hypothetical protein
MKTTKRADSSSARKLRTKQNSTSPDDTVMEY